MTPKLLRILEEVSGWNWLAGHPQEQPQEEPKQGPIDPSLDDVMMRDYVEYLRKQHDE